MLVPHWFVWGRRAGCAAVMLAAWSASAGAQVLADSMADYSSTQGYKGWRYGFFDGDAPAPFSADDFEPFPRFDSTVPPGVWIRQLGTGGYWTAVNRTAMHPNGAQSGGGRIKEENWAVRRWISPATLPVTIHGHVADAGPGGGDGALARIIVDGAVRFQRVITDGDTAGADFSFQACLRAGDIVDLVLAPNGPSDMSDGAIFTAVIQGPIVAQPAPAFSCAGGSASFRVLTGGTGPFRYQWKHDGEPIAGATSATLVIDPVGPGDVGLYSCEVEVFACGLIESDPAGLSICAIDFNCDGFVDFADYLDFLSLYDGQDARADLNQDTFVDFVDYLEFVNLFNQGC